MIAAASLQVDGTNLEAGVHLTALVQKPGSEEQGTRQQLSAVVNCTPLVLTGALTPAVDIGRLVS